MYLLLLVFLVTINAALAQIPFIPNETPDSLCIPSNPIVIIKLLWLALVLAVTIYYHLFVNSELLNPGKPLSFRQQLV